MKAIRAIAIAHAMVFTGAAAPAGYAYCPHHGHCYKAAMHVPERVKTCRRRHAIHQVENRSSSEAECEAARIDLDDLFVVTQLFSYPGTYVSARPTIEDMAEMLDKFEEAVLRSQTATIHAESISPWYSGNRNHQPLLPVQQNVLSRN